MKPWTAEMAVPQIWFPKETEWTVAWDKAYDEAKALELNSWDSAVYAMWSAAGF